MCPIVPGSHSIVNEWMIPLSLGKMVLICSCILRWRENPAGDSGPCLGCVSRHGKDGDRMGMGFDD